MDVSVTIHTQNPAGTMIDFAGGTVPFGYLQCNGDVVSRVTFARLFEAIGTVYGAGDGSTTFKLPDIRGRVAVGSGQGSSLTNRTTGQTGGAETHALSEAELASHTHIQNSHNHSQNAHSHVLHRTYGGSIGTPLQQINDNAFSNNGWNKLSADLYTESETATNNPFTATNQNTGGGQAHNNMQPFLVVTKVIKY